MVPSEQQASSVQSPRVEIIPSPSYNNNTSSPEIQPGSEPTGRPSITQFVGQSPPTSPVLGNVSLSLVTPNGNGYRLISDGTGTGTQAVPQSQQEENETKLNTQEKTEQVAPPPATSTQTTSLLSDDVGDYDFSLPIVASTT